MSDRLPSDIAAEQTLARLGALNVDWFRYTADYAAEAHGDQIDKSGRLYFNHCLRVAAIALELAFQDNFNPGETPLIASEIGQIALLHDVLEDTWVTDIDLIARYRLSVVMGVKALTRNKQMNYRDWIRTLTVLPLPYRLVKLADLFDNLSPDRTHPNQRAMAQDRYLPAGRMLMECLPFNVLASTKMAELEAFYAGRPALPC